MKKYIAFFRLRFNMGLQYRMAAVAGTATQFAWAFFTILGFCAFYETDAAGFPMSLSSTVSYIWLQQAFFFLFSVWGMDNEIFDVILNGDVAYELCRPVHIFHMWFARGVAGRLSGALLRCLPILVLSPFLPAPFSLMPPAGGLYFLLFLISLALGLAVTIALCTLVYILAFFTISPQGLRTFVCSSVELLAGAVIPLPFFPERIRFVVELLPFASMQNVALRIYSGSMEGPEIVRAISLQLFWGAALIFAGVFLARAAEKKIVIQGG